MIFPDNIELYTPFQLFTEEECEHIIADAQRQSKGIQSGTVATALPKGRSSTTYWYKPNFPVDNFLNYFQPFIDQNFLVKQIEKPVQIAKYQTGDYFGWHYDQMTGKRSHGRLLTLTCTLQTAPNAYFETNNQTFKLEQGEAVIIPANVLHRATSPTEGERWSMTVWAIGKITKVSKRK